jgi:hypothetical protein
MKERKLTHICTEHMIKNKLEKIIKATKEHTACSNRCVKNMLVLYMESPAKKQKLPCNKYLWLKNLN